MNSGIRAALPGELCWFPSAALESYVRWEAVDSLHCESNVVDTNAALSGLYTFTAEGDLLAFEAERYYGGGAEAVRTTWRVTATAWTTFDGLRVPYKHDVTWRLPERDFHLAYAEITDLSVNKPPVCRLT